MVKGFPTLQRKLNKAANFNRRKNSILSRWYNVTWQIDGSGRAYNTPTLGAELVVNGGMETGNPPSSWASANSAILTTVTDARPGSTGTSAISVSNGIASAASAQQFLTNAAGQWLMYSLWSRGVTTGASFQILSNGGSGLLSLIVTAGTTWTQIVQGWRTLGANERIRLLLPTSTISHEARYDDVSALEITLPTTLATVAGSTNNLTVAAKIHTIITGTQIGVASLIDNYNNPQNFIIAYHDGTNVRLEKCVAGVYTQLISTAVTFVSNAQIEIRRPSGNTFQLWYNGVQINTDQTVSDSEIINNNLYGMFSTYNGNLISEFTLGGVVIPFTF